MEKRIIGENEFNKNTISLIRIVATFAILLCHYVGWFDKISFMGQIFNVGVPLFFVISGFLFGSKTIDDPIRWIKKRMLRILIPVYLYYAIFTVVLLFIGKLGSVSMLNVAKQILNIHGFIGGGIGNVATGHLWFISYIVLCYIVTPLLQLACKKLQKRQIILGIITIVFIEILLMLSCSTFEFMSAFAGCIGYITAYFYRAHGGKQLGRREYAVLSIFTAVMLFIRFLGRIYIDGTRLYDFVIVPWSHCVLAFWIFFSLFWLGEKIFGNKKEMCSLSFLNEISYYVYIVHYCLIVGPISLKSFTGNMAVNSICFFIFSFVMAYILKQLDNLVNSLLLHSRQSIGRIKKGFIDRK